ncbi:MAG: hypothetical protein ACYC6K_01480 [Bellilinea sp.]
MNYKGGVIIIGSLLWDNSARSEWRKSSLQALETKVPFSVRIRYGRESGKQRCHTYTMIFSNHPTTELGQGYIVGLKQNIENKKMLKEQAIALAKAEGIWAEDKPFLGRNWGAVGLLANENKTYADWIKSNWLQIFQENRCEQSSDQFNHEQYSIGNELPVIDKNGFLQIDWPPEMDNFDFLLATPTVPKPNRTLTAREIAERMVEKDYRIYFDKNRESNITTFQDDEISGFLPI